MWVAVVLRVISALFAVPAFIDGVSVGVQITLVVVIVATIVGVVLVRPALVRTRTTARL
jgi:ABC-type amino acid transport system permease subunit